MNIRYLQKLLSRVDEIKIIGKKSEIDDIVFNVAGILRYGQQLRLIMLEYNEQYCQQIEEREISDLCNVRQTPASNRISLKSKEIVTQYFRFIRNVRIGDLEFEVNGSENRRLNIQDGESILFLSELLRNGWEPEGVDYQNIDMLFLNSIELVGDFDKIPDFKGTSLHFIMNKDNVSYLAELPVTLTVNGEYPDKLWFKNKDTGEENWVQINRVYLMNMWDEMEKTFSSPKLLEQMTKEQIDTAKKDFEERFAEICPQNMCYPVVEYECEEYISLQFYTKEFLESAPVHKSGSSMGFIMSAENTTGILGMKLKAAIIQEPVPANTVSIEAELFQYYKTVTPDDIII